MQRDERNKPVLEWILSVCIEHMYDIIDMSSIAIHLNQNDYHPIGHDNVMVDLFPINYQNHYLAIGDIVKILT